MSLASVYDTVQAGCASIPQTGYVGTEPLARYQFTLGEGVNRPYWQFTYPVRLRFSCESPPATFGFYFYEKPDGESSTDPLFVCGGYMAACASPGTALGTSRWFTMVTLGIQWRGGPSGSVDWIHLMDYKTGVGSVGLVRLGVPFPVS